MGVRPSTGGIPACAEMAARYFALLQARQRTLPKNFAAVTAAEFELDTRYFKLSPDVKTLVGYKDWMASMAALVGCEVKLWKYLFQPHLFVPVAATTDQSLAEAYRLWLRHLRIKKLWEG